MNTGADTATPDLFSFSSAGQSPDEVFRIEDEDYVHDAFMNLFSEECGRFILKSESFMLKLAYAYNKILSLSNSRTRILAHQVESTHRIVNSFRQRFLIADEVGLGKTIEAGLVIKEMIYRHNYTRILIVCPASLLFQWQNEMESKFNEKFIIMDRRLLGRAAAGNGGANPWNVHNKVICSLDFIKNKNFEDDLSRTHWDAVIFDEAHRLRRDSSAATIAYNAAEVISSRTKSLILLSATPFRGKLEELYYLIALLDKNILGPFQTFYNEFCIDCSDLSVLKRKLDQVVIRRTKNEIGGFTKRYARTIRFDLYDDERFLYDETTRYVAEEFNRALQSENRAVGFVMTVFQKLLDSSSYALRIALSNRSARLKELLARAAGDHEQLVSFNNNFFDSGTMPDADDTDENCELVVQRTIDELKLEIATLDRLVEIALRIEVNKKGEKLVRLISDLSKKGHAKFLIFTQFRTTQDYLYSILSGYDTVVFNGSMNRDQKEEAILKFRESAEVLIATEAGGEGRNMQFCDVLVNYDLPWSPLKIEQRIGRIHRFGQPNDVHIYNFSTRDTVAERVLEVLTEKLKLFEESIGTPDIMLGQIEDEVNLNTLFMELASGRKKKREVDNELTERIESARQSFEKLSELTVAGRMDFNYDEYYRVTLKERSFNNRRIEKFVSNFLKLDDHASGMITAKNCRQGEYKVRHSAESEFRRGTFDSEKALEDDSMEFLAFGHAVVDGIIDYCHSRDFGGETGIVFIEHKRPLRGILFNFLVKFRAVTVTHEFVPVLVVLDNPPLGRELEDIEDKLRDLEFAADCDPGDYGDAIHEIHSGCAAYFSEARTRIKEKIDRRLCIINENLDLQLDPELEKVRESYTRQIRELEEKLDLQESQMKWYGKDMRSTITRTRNRIMKARREMDSIIREYNDYYDAGYEVRLVGAAVLLSTGNC
ncbi:MAG TPA: SNF2-related protein [Spirochaetota bacterium]|nr:SNF2-related protein [Spirochaetota bacterium]